MVRRGELIMAIYGHSREVGLRNYIVRPSSVQLKPYSDIFSDAIRGNNEATLVTAAEFCGAVTPSNPRVPVGCRSFIKRGNHQLSKHQLSKLAAVNSFKADVSSVTP